MTIHSSMRKPSIPVIALFFVLLGLCFQAQALTVDKADRLVEQWLATERQATRLETEWLAQKPVLAQRIALLEAEKAQLEGILASNSDKQSDVDARRAELLAEQTRMEDEQAQLRDGLKILAERLDYLARLLPPPLVAPWQKEQQALADSSQISTTLQVALAQLALITGFDQRVSMHEMPLKAPDGTDVLVKQLYLGVGSAWFVSGDGGYKGQGYASPEGWTWTFDNSLDGDEIAKSMAIFEKHQEAEFVNLPLRINERGSL